MVDVVLFDLFETLITESETRPAGAASLGPRLGLDDAAYRPEWRQRRLAIVTGRQTFVDVLAEIGTTLGSTPASQILEAVRQERVEVKARALATIPREVVHLLDELLQQGKRIGVISNCIPEDVVSWAASALGSRVEHAIFSFAVGCSKPDAAIYREALRRFGVTPDRALFVGDGMSGELDGASAVGLRAFRAGWFVAPADATSQHATLREPREVLALVD